MRLVLIDGHAILHRAFHAYPPLTTSNGELVGAVYGFSNILFTVLKKLHPEYVAVTFDKKGPTFRHKKFLSYKAHRPAMDEGLSVQIPRVHDVLEALNIPVFELEGYEADDIIGTLTKKAGKNIETFIVTGDADALQLVNPQVKVFMPGRGMQYDTIFDEHKVKEKYNLKPEQIIDLKALAGDPSDGIPGVKGIGPKTAIKLISQYGSVDKIYENLSSLDLKSRKKLIQDKQNAMLSKELATIDINVPLKFDLSCCTLSDYDKSRVIKLFEKLEFASLIKKLPDQHFPESGKNEKDVIKKEEQMDLF